MMILTSDNHEHHLADDKHVLSWAWYDDIDDGKHELLDDIERVADDVDDGPVSGVEDLVVCEPSCRL